MVDATMPRALHWPGRQRLEALAGRVSEVLGRWRRTWLDDCAPPALETVCATAAQDLENSNWRIWRQGIDADDSIWISGGLGPPQILQLLLRPQPGASKAIGRVAAGLAQEALDDLLETMRQALSDGMPTNAVSSAGVASTIPAMHCRAWSGAVRLRIPLAAGSSLFLHLGPARVRALSDAPPARRPLAPIRPPASLQEALDRHPARLRVTLSEVEISLGQLQDLAVGDVLLLPHPLTQALHVVTGQGQTVCAAYLGQAQGAKAVELVRDAPPAGA